MLNGGIEEIVAVEKLKTVKRWMDVDAHSETLRCNSRAYHLQRVKRVYS